jgi:alanine dehydrogenase
VILDISIDQGGCVETSRPTTLMDPVFTRHGVIHYAVPNMTANIARSASRALANAFLSYLLSLAERGVKGALESDPGLALGVYLARGKMVNVTAGAALGMPVVPLDEALGKGGRG